MLRSAEIKPLFHRFVLLEHHLRQGNMFRGVIIDRLGVFFFVFPGVIFATFRTCRQHRPVCPVDFKYAIGTFAGTGRSVRMKCHRFVGRAPDLSASSAIGMFCCHRPVGRRSASSSHRCVSVGTCWSVGIKCNWCAVGRRPAGRSSWWA